MPDDNEIDESSDVASDNDYDDAENDKDDEQDDDGMADQSYMTGDRDGDGTSPVPKPKLDPKDPSRPRRKKARRACYACQRAHLTCGDERPCQRCVKRGIGEGCQDGVRKKAKYLHDAPPEALRPVLGPTYNIPRNGGSSGGNLAGSPTTSNSSSALTGFYSQTNPSPTYSMQFQSMRNTQMPPPLQDQLSYNNQQSPISPSSTFQTPNLQRPVSMQSMTSTAELQNQSSYSGPRFDPSNPAIYNFDLEGLNFTNHYGALEFGILNHMSSGATDTPPKDIGSISHHSGGENPFNTPMPFNSNAVQYDQLYPQQDAMMQDYVAVDNNHANPYDIKNHLPLARAYVIESGTTSLASPDTDSQLSPQPSLAFENSPQNPAYNASSAKINAHHNQQPHHRQSKRQDGKAAPVFDKSSLHKTAKRKRDPSSIYKRVTEPYSYTTGFHSLTAMIQRRFSANVTYRIAKSLASIRPSFISCTKTLNQEDLIFMEKCFQRTLFEYEEFMRDWGTPTLVCRRTGEIAAVNKEFTLLTGWTKSVLLGREANLNVNTGRPSTSGSSRDASQGNTGRAGLVTPRTRLNELPKYQEGRPQPVFIAELLDDDAVLDFYEDFAKLAFGDSRGSVTKLCKLLKYQTKDSIEDGLKKEEIAANSSPEAKPRRPASSGLMLGGRVSKIDGENGIVRLERDGKMDCAYCWTVKRDVFDIPMLIVMNFLPCI